ncbi:hypothetical protein [Spiroplasma endosymbiont of Sarcophaga variegata]|uniref:hypothetical protein n=1 Tax=Spiroplasma endosymbiont of Sarcophaga variegata TaxID=3066304 RepID=UPI003AF871D9
MTIYNPIMILENSQIFKYQYSREQSTIKIKYLYKTTNDIEKYIETLNKTYTTFYKETVEVKYLKLIPYFLPIEEAKQRIKNLVNTLIRILTIMSPTFVVPLNISFRILIVTKTNDHNISLILSKTLDEIKKIINMTIWKLILCKIMILL